MSKRTYTEITKNEFEQTLSETSLQFTREDYSWAGEIIYEADSDNGMFTLRVYSSISKHTGKSRENGSDAIRTVVLHTQTGRPVLKEKRTNRIKTWKKNLKQKINTLSDKQSDIQICDECGSVMVIRENSSGDEFYGCSSYPDCENTKSI
jgi:hypothetical protein